VRIRVRQTRPILPGDKLASRYSQKGTIGAERSNVVAPPGADDGADFGTIRFAQNMPRVASGPNRGLVPDIIINPACMPSRMTIGKLFEGVCSKAAAYTGARYDGTAFRAFTESDIGEIARVLESVGLDGGGYETLEHADGSPFLGALLPGAGGGSGARVFVVACYYQFLRHTVLDKIQFRSDGFVTLLTHQPVGGRSKEGGLRQGEMEKAAMCSWGAAELVRERLMRASDMYQYEVCATCGNQASTQHSANVRECRVCPPGRANIVVVDSPFVHLLVSRMVSCLGINASLVGLRPPHRAPDV